MVRISTASDVKLKDQTMGWVGGKQTNRVLRLASFAVASFQSLLLMSCVTILSGCRELPAEPVRGEASDRAPALHAVDFGVLRAGESKFIRIWISNSQQKRVRIVHWECSCHCVSIFPAQLTIDAGKRTLVNIEYAPDANGANEFVGKLQLRCIGLNEAGNEIARIEAAVEVIRLDGPDSSK